MFPLIDCVGDKMLHYIENLPEATSSEGIETKELAAKFTTDVVASCAFGLDGKSFEDPQAEFREMGKKFISPSFWTGIKHMLIFIMPSLSNVLRIRCLKNKEKIKFYKAKNTIFLFQNNS